MVEPEDFGFYEKIQVSLLLGATTAVEEGVMPGAANERFTALMVISVKRVPFPSTPRINLSKFIARNVGGLISGTLFLMGGNSIFPKNSLSSGKNFN